MKAQKIILAALSISLMFAFNRISAQEAMCPMGASGTPPSPPPSLHVGVVLVQFSDWATHEDARGGVCQVHPALQNFH